MNHSKEQHFFHLIQVLEFGLKDNLVCLINICSLAFYYWNNLHGLSPLMMFINCNLLFTTIINLFQNIHGYFLSKLFQVPEQFNNRCSTACHVVLNRLLIFNKTNFNFHSFMKADSPAYTALKTR